MLYVTAQPVPRIRCPKTGLSKGFPAPDAKKYLAGRVQKVPPLIIIGNITAVEVNAAPKSEYLFIASTAKITGYPFAIQVQTLEVNPARTTVGFKQAMLEPLPLGHEIVQRAHNAVPAIFDRQRIDISTPAIPTNP